MAKKKKEPTESGNEPEMQEKEPAPEKPHWTPEDEQHMDELRKAISCFMPLPPPCKEIALGPREFSPPMIHSFRPTAKAYAAIAGRMADRYPGVHHHGGHMHEVLNEILEAYADAT